MSSTEKTATLASPTSAPTASFLLRATTLSTAAPTGAPYPPSCPPGGSTNKSAGAMELFEFLRSAELEHYFTSFHEQLRVRTVAQLKYVQDCDLHQMGLTAPEQRRLWKFFQRQYPQTTAGKLRKRLSRSTSGRSSTHGNCQAPEDPLHTDALLNGNGGDASYHHNSAGLLLDGGASVHHDGEDSAEASLYHHHHLILPEHLELGAQLGEGEFGKVHQGVWHSETGPVQVAIKVLCTNLLDTGQMADFLKEVAVMHSVSHAHIVRLYGIVMERASLHMVTELAPLRSLLECLREETLRMSLSILTLHHFAMQIAQGMAYLERKRLIHRDLAARNILVFSKDKVKISDFGMSKALQLGAEYYQSQMNANMKLPMAWCAPESINYLRFTSASDVWAYGVVLWEMFSYGFQPWAGLTGDQILDQIDEPVCARLAKPELCPTQHYELMRSCWEHEARRRCSFQQIVGQLPRMAPERCRILRDVMIGETLSSTTESTQTVGSATAKRTSSGNGPENGIGGGLLFAKGDVVVILDKSSPDLWKASHLSSGRLYHFPPSSLAPVLGDGLSTESNVGSSHNSGGNSVSTGAVGIYQFLTGRLRKSKRQSTPVADNVGGGGANSSRGGSITREMISLPQNDFRHVMHVGSDGNTFGDVAFLKTVQQTPASASAASPAVTLRSENEREYCGLGDGSSVHSMSSSVATGANGSTGPHMKTTPNSRRPHPDGVSSPSDTLTSVSDLDAASVMTSATPQQSQLHVDDPRRKSSKSKPAPPPPPPSSSSLPQKHHLPMKKSHSPPASIISSSSSASKYNRSIHSGHHHHKTHELSDDDDGGSEDYESIEVGQHIPSSSGPLGGCDLVLTSTTASVASSHIVPPSLPPARPHSSVSNSSTTSSSFHGVTSNAKPPRPLYDEKEELSDSLLTPSAGESLLGGSLFDDILKCLDSIGTSMDDDAVVSSNPTKPTPVTDPHIEISPTPGPNSINKENKSPLTAGVELTKKTKNEEHKKSSSLAPETQPPKTENRKSSAASALFSSFRHHSSSTGSSSPIYSRPFKNGLGLSFGSKNKSTSKTNTISSTTVTTTIGPPAEQHQGNVISGPVLISTTNTQFSSVGKRMNALGEGDSVDSSVMMMLPGGSNSSSSTLASQTSSLQPTATVPSTTSNYTPAVGGAMRALQRNKDGVFLAGGGGPGSGGTLSRRRASQNNMQAATLSMDSGTLHRARQPSLPLTTQVARSITEVVASSTNGGGSSASTSGHLPGITATLHRRLSLSTAEEMSEEGYSHYGHQSNSNSDSNGSASISSPSKHSATSSHCSPQKGVSTATATTSSSILGDDFWGGDFSQWMSGGGSAATTKANGGTLIEACQQQKPAMKKTSYVIGETDDEDVCAL